MLLVVQHPLSDARPFIAASAASLRLPQWPPDTPEDVPGPPEFVRCFGPATRRRHGADLAFVDELSYFRANRALRLKYLGARAFGLERRLRTSCVFRRLLLSESRAVVRVEAGVHLPLLQDGLRLDFEGLVRAASGVFQVWSEVRVPGVGLARGPLLRQGRRLADLFAHATTDRHTGAAPDGASVQPGMPMLLVQYEEGEIAEGGLEGTALVRVDPARVRGAVMAFGRLGLDGHSVPFWVLGPGEATWTDLRSLRLCILRLHAEQAALDRLLKLLDRFGRLRFEPGTPEGDLLEDYLNEATRLINRESWDGQSQSAVREAFDAACSVEPPAAHLLLERRYEGVRRQVRKKVEDYERRRYAVREVTQYNVASGGTINQENVRIQGDKVVYKSTGVVIDSQVGQLIGQLNGTYQQFARECPNEELRTAVAELHEQLKGLLERLPAEAAATPIPAEVVAKAEELTREAAAPEPRPEKLEKAGTGLLEALRKLAGTQITRKGLKEAAETVADLVGPISKAVGGVLALFGAAAVL